jgi:hypothetical protein
MRAPGVPPRHNDGMPDEPRAPWDHQQTPLARAFARAFDRFQAVAGDQADQLVTGDQQAKALALSGLELDPHELGLYMEELVAGYTQLALEGDDAHAIAVMRGLAIHALVVGELHAADRIQMERVRSADPQLAANEAERLEGAWRAGARATGATYVDEPGDTPNLRGRDRLRDPARLECREGRCRLVEAKTSRASSGPRDATASPGGCRTRSTCRTSSPKRGAQRSMVGGRGEHRRRVQRRLPGGGPRRVRAAGRRRRRPGAGLPDRGGRDLRGGGARDRREALGRPGMGRPRQVRHRAHMGGRRRRR